MRMYRSRLARSITLFTLVGAAATLRPHDAVPIDLASSSAHPEGTLKLVNRYLPVGSAVAIGGEEFAAGGILDIQLVGLAGAKSLGKVAADSLGSFSRSFEVPANLDIGAYRLVAIAADGDEVASLSVELVAAVAVTDGPDHDDDANEHTTSHGASSVTPTDEPLVLDRARSPMVTGGVLVSIILALAGGGLMLRRPQRKHYAP